MIKFGELLRYRVLPILATIVVLLGAYDLRHWLQRAESNQVAVIGEAESYAARSRLVRNVNELIRSLRDAQAFWATNAHLPPEDWARDASVEMVHYDGIQFLFWSDQSGAVRYLHNEEHPMYDYRPEESEWGRFRDLLDIASDLKTDTIRGPLFEEDGSSYFEIYLLSELPDVPGTLIARFETEAALNGLLLDESPGYRITVEWDGHRVYERGERLEEMPENWVHHGLIRSSLGTVWNVIHAPTPALVRTMTTPAVRFRQLAGFIVAILMGLLLYESGRADRRARAAEQAERELGRLNQELEEQVRDRTRDLAERSNDLVTISESVGHDLRNPLNSISANTQLVQQLYGDELGKDGRALLDQIGVCIENMTEILDRLLALSSVASSEFNRERIDMHALAAEIFADLAEPEPAPRPRLEMDDVPDAMGEPIMVGTLLMNLFSNAVKYTRNQPERRIRFSASRDQGEVVYCVEDTGIGFDESVGDRLFRAFERLHDGPIEGLGLGLDIAARVVQRHQGRIFATGEPGKGARFCFTLGEEGLVTPDDDPASGAGTA
ncbi:MAG: hypothetical protein HKN58_06720 [Xanthomonadales bacterium]|nr:hypothetical protein [Xanthomonadales bacterium]